MVLCNRARSEVRFCGTPVPVVTMAARSPGVIASTAASAIWRAMIIGRSSGIERSMRMKISLVVSWLAWLVATPVVVSTEAAPWSTSTRLRSAFA
jgi:hypothetical protein